MLPDKIQDIVSENRYHRQLSDTHNAGYAIYGNTIRVFSQAKTWDRSHTGSHIMDNNNSQKSGIQDFISFDDYDKVPGFVISQAAYAISKTLTRRIKEAGINVTPHEFAILNRLTEHKTLNQKEIALLTYKDRPAVTRMLERMIAKGFVIKRVSKDDRRAYQVELTQQGRVMRDKIVPIATGVMTQALNGSAHEQQETTIKTLQQITDNLDLQGG